jgi:uncharacterized protein YbjT (DUF2867 family)
MRVALFGGAGTVGTQLLAQALAGGHEVRALVRNPDRLPVLAGPITVVTGDVHDRAAVDAVIAGSAAVLSALGGTNREDPHLIEACTAGILDSMRRHGVSRVVAVQGFHLPFPGDPGNAGQRLMRRILRLANAALLEDSLAMAVLLSGSDAEWTIVRAPRIYAGPVTAAGYRTGTLRLGPWSTVSSGDVARFALACLENGLRSREAPMIAGGGQAAPMTRSVPSQEVSQ